MALIEVRKLVKQFDGRTVLSDIDLDLEEGEIKVIMGPSGCGKSTLLRCLNRLIEPTSGRVYFRGEEVTLPQTDVRALRQRIGFVFQQFALYRHLNVLENVTLGLRRLRRMPVKEANEKARHELGRMSMLKHEDKYPGQLSGGQKQRVAIARALAMDPAVLFFDEPTSALDPLMSQEIIGVIRQLRRDNVTMLCVTHDLNLAQGISERAIFLDEGVVHAEDSIERLFGDHEDPRIREFFRQGNGRR